MIKSVGRVHGIRRWVEFSMFNFKMVDCERTKYTKGQWKRLNINHRNISVIPKFVDTAQSSNSLWVILHRGRWEGETSILSCWTVQ
jgi:hypothetical protein